jgi:leucyl-tRNA synthetase
MTTENTTDDSRQRYPFQEIERKWQARWAEADTYHTTEQGDKPKYYVLDMFPYPSGSGLHVGHCRNYVPGDVVARLMYMQGRNVLHPMGWDAFGQPAEQDAIKRNVNPAQVVPLLAQEYKRQMSLLGIGYDWDREINSTDPSYYKWNQWAFELLYERGLAYRKLAPVNWCPNENTVLANEDVVDGRCWRCDAVVVKKDMMQWFFKITEYGDKLIEGLDRIDWPEGVKTQQRDWIGRSEGVEFDIPVDGYPEAKVRVFTTRVDTVFGVSFVVLSPEHALVTEITTTDQRSAIDDYRAKAAKLTDQDRTDEKRERTGVFTGAYAVNPVTGHKVPIYIADYVLAGYGTGAIMAVPAHDTRDFDFARRYGLPTPIVIARDEKDVEQPPLNGDDLTEAFTSYDGITINSGEFSGLPCKVAARRIAEWMESKGIGTSKINFRLRDWLVSRQRYWGTPIPIIHCKTCGAVPVPREQLPVVLPPVENYKPNPDGRSPLAAIADFVNTTCPKCGQPAERETDTMAGSVDSSWYFLRFTSPHENDEPWDRAASDYWMPVDRYIGGREHAVGHLLYSRFFTKVFYDAGFISFDEPFQTLKNQGMLLGLTTVDADTKEKKPIKPEEFVGYDRNTFISNWEKGGKFQAERIVKPDGEEERVEPVTVEYQWLKMSKSKGNAVTPDEMAAKYGADALRLFILFSAPFEDSIQWSEEALNGTFRFLNRTWDAVMEVAPAYQPDWAERIGEATSSEERTLRRKTHQAILKVTDDITEFRFNTAVSAMMIFGDALRRYVQANGNASPAAHEAVASFAKLLSPLAPHIADEMWEKLGYTGQFLYQEAWPVGDPAIAAEDEITLVVQINGKVRERLVLPADSDAKVCEMSALASDKVQAEIAGKTIRKVIVVPGKLVNIVAG